MNKKIKNNILIVEDDETSIIFFQEILKKYNYEISIVRTAQEAISMCQNNKSIDLILMDIKLPGMNGYEATQKIREFNPEIIIIAQTAYALKGDRDKALKAGCDDYLSKPIDEAKLNEILEKYL